MASKKKDFNEMATGLGTDFISAPEEKEAPAQKSTGKRRVNPGEQWRANLLLDIDLQEPIFLQALRQKKSVSALVSEILREYLRADEEM